LTAFHKNPWRTLTTKIRSLSREILIILTLGDRRLKTRLINTSIEIIELPALIDDKQGSISLASKELKIYLQEEISQEKFPH